MQSAAPRIWCAIIWKNKFSLRIPTDFPGWDYTITKPVGETVATVSKELLQWTDTYVLDIVDPADALHVLMFVLAIDAEKCSAK